MTIKHLLLLLAALVTLTACNVLGDSAAVTNVPSDAEATVIPENTEPPAATETAMPPATETSVPEPTTTSIPTATSEPQPEAEAAETGSTDDQPGAAEGAVQSGLQPAEILNDEGGTMSITGEVNYTNAFFTDGVAEPVIILEDQAGFVDRNEFFIMPVASQTLGQITSDFFDPPFTYSLALPIEPQGTLRDVDNDGQEDTGVQVFAVAYWTNTFGDPYLEERDLSGGGWSTAYASTLTSSDAETNREIVGGKLLVYAPEAGQGFPAGFGADELLFTADDPIVALPQGYTVVDLDSDPFTFDRSRDVVIDLIEPETSALVDYSDLSYTEAFDALVDQLSKEYAFTEYKNLDWDQIHSELRPQFEAADEAQDPQLYRKALSDLALSIPDGHISGPFIRDEFIEQVSGGLGIAIRELDDGRVLVNFLTPRSPADEAGIALGAEILAINNVPISEAITNTEQVFNSFSSDHVRRLQQMRYVTRFPVGTEVDLTFRNPDSEVEETVSLTAEAESESFSFSSFTSVPDGFELPVEYAPLEGSPFVLVQINSFSDNHLLAIQLWERMIRSLQDQGTPGLIIDMRQNRGGNGFLANAMAAYFFDEPFVLGNTGYYDEELDTFYFDERGERRLYLPAEELRYDGDIAVLVGPNCNSACEFFSYAMTVDDRAAVVGQYPTAGLGGSVEQVRMPEGEMFQFTKGRAVDAEGNIHIEGIGVVPTVPVPVDEATLFSEGDPVLDAAVDFLRQASQPDIVDAGIISLGEELSGTLEAEKRTQYTLQVSEGEVIDLRVSSTAFDPGLLLLDTSGNILLVNDNLDDNTTAAGFIGLEIPVDLTLVLHVVGPEETSSGDFTISATVSGE